MSYRLLLIVVLTALGGLLFIAGVQAGTGVRSLAWDSPLPPPTTPQAYLPLIRNGKFWSTSFYMTSVDYTTVWYLGCESGNDTLNGEDLVVILDFGPPWYNGVTYGTRLFNSQQFVSTIDINHAARAFMDGFYFCSYDKPNIHANIAVGTNNNPNFGGLIEDHGVVWAYMVNGLNDWINRDPAYALKFTARGAIDIELSFAPASQTMPWVDGYISAYEWPSDYYNFGACEDCATSGTLCPQMHFDWTCEKVYRVSYGVLPAWPIPEIYLTNGVNAEQWAWLSRWAIQNGRSPMHFKGSLTQWQACQTNPPCNGADNRPEQGWAQLYEALNPYPGCGTCQELDWATDMKYASSVD